MILSQKRVRNIATHLNDVPEGTQIVICAQFPSNPEDLKGKGFISCDVGEAILPSPLHGPACRYNSNGRYIIHRDRPKVPCYRVVEWEWDEIHGNERIHRSDFKEIVRMRYQRTFVPPFGTEIRVITDLEGNRMISCGQFSFVPDKYEQIKNSINIILELFGFCVIMTEGLESLFLGSTRRVNWKILPSGSMPWESLLPQLSEVINRQPPGNRKIIAGRFEHLNKLGATQVVIGRGGFDGYVVFSFPEKNLHVFECVKYDNATYVFGSDWETLSRLTKADVIEGGLCLFRVVHRLSWHQQMTEIILGESERQVG